MSDESVLVPGSAAEQGASVVMTAGMLLRQAREATGLHVAALAVAMKVPVRKLEALEADRLQDLPDAVFVRALAASVCRTLKVDPAPVLAKLPLSAVPKLDQNERGLNMPVTPPSFLAAPKLSAFVVKPSVLLVGVILLAALAVLFFPEVHHSVSPAPAAAPAEAEAPAPVMAAPVADSTAQPAAAAGTNLQMSPQLPTPALPLQTAVPTPAPTPTPTPAVAAAPVATPAAAVVAATAPAAAAPASGILVFKATAASWVRVSDSAGSVVLEKTLQAGESAAANGKGPLSVVVGNVAGTEVLLRGQPYGMTDLNQNNVARFEVK